MDQNALKIAIYHTLGEDYALCTGCAACAAICPTDAITMQSDQEGFLQPNVHSALCIDCDLCKKVCPVTRAEKIVMHETPEQSPRQLPVVWAAWNKDSEMRRQSSSGGVFTVLAENVLEKGGVVVGAAFDEQLVVRHCLVETKEDLHRLRGSKYIQSEISPRLYQEVQRLLNQGRHVLFAGTPCQVAGLRNYTQKSCENMYCCDIVCMGVPSSLLFHKYIDWKNTQSESKIHSCGFRDKSFGWKSPRMTLGYKNGSFECVHQSAYYLAFLKRIALRFSCYACQFKGVTRGGDITLADFWGVAKRYPEYDTDDRGTSLVLVNSSKGQTWLDSCRSRLFCGPADIDTAIAGNPMLVRPAERPAERDTFYYDLDALAFKALIRKYQLCRPPFYRRAIGKVKRRLNNAIQKLINLDSR